jgi:acetyl-CoA C-acetyltransferase
MSRVPYFAEGARWGMRMGNTQLVDGMYRDGFNDPLSGLMMGQTAEKLARQYEISRTEQDGFALRSQQKAEAAISSGRFKDEVLPLEIAGRKNETTTFAQDEHCRAGAALKDLAKLPPVFYKDGSVTAGNSSGITDGAAALLLLAESEVTRRGLKPLAWVEGGVTRALDPKVMGLGPVPAVRALEARTKRSLKDYDLVELNEAFAAQVLAVDRELGFDPERLNVNGGAISLGHPIGASGARIVVTLLHEMARRKAQKGLATLCVSGGLGVAASFLRDA